MTQQWLFTLSVAALSLSASFVAIGVSVILIFEKPKKWHAYLFFGLASLMLLFFMLGWHSGWTLPIQDDAVMNKTRVNGDVLPLCLSAIGTISLALITFIAVIFIPWHKKPKFTVEFDNAEPFCRATPLSSASNIQPTVSPPTPPTLAYWLRLRVTNSGKSVAKRCIGKLVKVMDNSGRELTNYDPVILHWVGTDWRDVPFRPVDLNQGEYEFLDVLVARTDYQGKVLICTDAYARGIPKDIQSGTYRIQITIYGDNVEPRTKQYRLIWVGSNYSDIILEEL